MSAFKPSAVAMALKKPRVDVRKPWKEEALKDGEMPSRTLEQIIEDAFNRGYTMKQIEAELA